MMGQKKKIAFIHRYGLEGWICCGGHAVPGIVESLSKDAEIHFFGPQSTEPKNATLRARLTTHELPYAWNRACPSDKITKTLLWYFWLPIIGIRCRLKGFHLIWNDETVPLTAPILQLFFGKNVAITVMDFFARIYTEKHPRLRWLSNRIERIDFSAWRRLPLIFTKVLYTQEFLAGHGVPKEVMHLYRNPVDHSKFHPVDETTRNATRKKWGFSDSDIVLSHHGILHPNKGNDWVLQRLAELKDALPHLKYLLIGNGPETENLKTLTTELEITDRVVFTGWLPSEEDLNNALASADIGLVMRIGQETDHFHMTDTLAHEMACGKPILAVNLKGIAEVIEDGKDGLLFSERDQEDFKRKLRQLVESTKTRGCYGQEAFTSSKEISSLEYTVESMCLLLQQSPPVILKEDFMGNHKLPAYRIAIVGGCLSGHGGGMPRSMAEQARSLVDQGLSVTFFTGYNKMYPYAPKELAIEHIPTHISRLWGPNLYGFPFGSMLKLWKQAPEFNVIHLNGHWNMTTFIAALIARIHKVPYAITTRGHLGKYDFKHLWFIKLFLYPLMEIPNIRHAALMHVCSTWEQEDSQRALAHAKRVVKLPNAVDCSKLLPVLEQTDARKALGIPEDATFYLFLSRVAPDKSPELLIESWAAAGKPANALLAIVGPATPDYEKKLLHLAARLKVSESVRFPGYADNETKRKWLSAADTFVLPSTDDSFSVAVIEAARFGLHCILSPYVGAVEFIPEEQVRIADLTTTAWTEALKEDVPLHDNASTQWADCCSLETIGKQWADLYAEISSSKSIHPLSDRML